MRRNELFRTLLLLVMPGCLLAAAAVQSPGASQTPAKSGIDRTALPVAEPPVSTIATLDAREAKAPPRFEVKAPKGERSPSAASLSSVGIFTGPPKALDCPKPMSSSRTTTTFGAGLSANDQKAVQDADDAVAIAAE
jgi:hypothetical protein